MLSNKVSHNTFSESFIIDKDLINEINRPIHNNSKDEQASRKQDKKTLLGKFFKKS